MQVGPQVEDRVRWSDVDIMGVVQFARYLRFVEAAETEFFRELGFTYAALASEHGIWLARLRLECDYRAPARLDDVIRCRAELWKMAGTSLAFRFPVEGADGTRLVDVKLALVALDRTTLRPARLPAPLRAAVQRTPEDTSDQGS